MAGSLAPEPFECQKLGLPVSYRRLVGTPRCRSGAAVIRISLAFGVDVLAR